MKKQDQEKLVSLPFKDFLELIDSEIDTANTKKQFEKIIEKLEVYKDNFTSDNEVYKLSTIDAIDGIIDDINKIEL